ncbi:Histidine protein methyltransferase 1 [Bulinus truncatus]|nr:Histidine protein methyltransferase 1 [Bulinus truncatus]
MSFLFSFSTPEECNSETLTGESELSQKITTEKEKKDDTISLPSFEVKDFYDDSFLTKLPFKTLTIGEHSFQIVDTKFVEEKLQSEENCIQSTQNVLDAVNSHSDLIAGKYEGGLKIWECGLDLVQFLSSHEAETIVEIKGKTILELGCGAGLPGLYCLKSGAQRVDFQDYNIDVLKLLTQPNVRRNISTEQCHYFAGDWGSFNQIAVENNLKYDVILTAETIYNPDNYSKILNIFKSALTDGGIVILAAKTYYFGVGGSIDRFIEYVNSCSFFHVSTILSIKQGVPRQIISLQQQSAK